MESKQTFEKLFEYDCWANHEALGSLSTVTEERPRRLLGHVIGAQRIWLSRLEQEDPASVEAWPSYTPEECRRAIDELAAHWKLLIGRQTPESLAASVVYRNTKGVEFRHPLCDVLLHVLLHSAYHRGQVAAAVREAGGQPAATDYIVWVRRAPRAAASDQ